MYLQNFFLPPICNYRNIFNEFTTKQTVPRTVKLPKLAGAVIIIILEVLIQVTPSLTVVGALNKHKRK